MLTGTDSIESGKGEPVNDSTILYAGVFCFAFMLLGMVLTVLEFRKMSAGENAKVRK